MDGYKIKVSGEYIARSGVMGKEKISKTYEVECRVPRMSGALSVIKNKLLDAALAKKYDDYVGFRTHHVVSVEPVGKPPVEDGKLPIRYMTREQLTRFIQVNALPVDMSYYPDLFKLREAVLLAYEDPKGYEKKFELRREDLELEREVAGMNPELFESTPTEAGFTADTPVSEQDKPAKSTKTASAGKKTRKAADKKTHESQVKDRMKGMARDLGVIDGEAQEAGDDLADV